jgi:hypothetical protein
MDGTTATIEPGFNLSIDEVRIIAKFRALAPHQQRGILQALELLKPSRPRFSRPALSPTAGRRWAHREM